MTDIEKILFNSDFIKKTLNYGSTYHTESVKQLAKEIEEYIKKRIKNETSK